MKNQTLIFKILLTAIGLLFILSGVSKLYPIYAFEFLLVKENILGWSLAPFAARLIIAVELIIGIHLTLQVFKRQLFSFFAIVMLFVSFTLTFVSGNVPDVLGTVA